MGESIHQKLERVRKPHVHITYAVETNGAEVVKELPFVVGVLGDFSGDPTEPLKPLRERKFINIDRDNFDQVMARMTPGLNLRVEDTLAGDGSETAVALKFEKLDDFEPAQVVKQVPQLQALRDARDKLRDLMSKADASVRLEELLEQVLQSTASLGQLASELSIDLGNKKLEADEPSGDVGGGDKWGAK